MDPVTWVPNWDSRTIGFFNLWWSNPKFREKLPASWLLRVSSRTVIGDKLFTNKELKFDSLGGMKVQACSEELMVWQGGDRRQIRWLHSRLTSHTPCRKDQ